MVDFSHIVPAADNAKHGIILVPEGKLSIVIRQDGAVSMTFIDRENATPHDVASRLTLEFGIYGRKIKRAALVADLQEGGALEVLVSRVVAGFGWDYTRDGNPQGVLTPDAREAAFLLGAWDDLDECYPWR